MDQGMDNHLINNHSEVSLIINPKDGKLNCIKLNFAFTGVERRISSC